MAEYNDIEKVYRSIDKLEQRLSQDLVKLESRTNVAIKESIESLAKILHTERIAEKELFNSIIMKLEETVSKNEYKIQVHTENHVRKNDVDSLMVRVNGINNEIDEAISLLKKEHIESIYARLKDIERWKEANWRQLIIYSVAAGVILYHGVGVLLKILSMAGVTTIS